MLGKFSCPVPRDYLKISPILHIHPAHRVLHAHVTVRVRQKGLDANQHFGNGQRQTPIVSQAINADIPVPVDVRV
jgi:hypothetical protein